MRPAAVALLVVVVLLLASCDSTEPLRPERLEATAVLQQNGVVGEAVLVAPAVRVTTARGKAVPGVQVTFAVTGGGGTLVTAARTTDATGIAIADGWTLGTTPGANTLVATTAGVTGPVTFTATAQHGSPARMLLLSVVNGEVQIGLPLPYPATVELRDRFDNPATTATTMVRAEIASGAGQLAGVTSVQAVGARAVFNNLVLSGTGLVVVAFAATGVESVFTAPILVVPPVDCGAGTVRLELDFAIGQMRRFTTSNGDAPGGRLSVRAGTQGRGYLGSLRTSRLPAGL